MSQNKQQNQTPVLTKAMEAAGISMKPKMSDIIEMVVTEKIKEFRFELARINENASVLSKEVKELNEENFTKAFRDIPYFKDLVAFSDKRKWSIEAWRSSYRSDFSSDYVHYISSESNASTVKLNLLSKSDCLHSGKGIIVATIKTDLGELKGEFTAEIPDSKEIKNLHKRILTHNEEVRKFREDWNNLSFSRMKAAIKSEFRKKSVQTLPAEVTKFLESTFNINL